jgi:carboxymethylenebutenolidase
MASGCQSTKPAQATAGRCRPDQAANAAWPILAGLVLFWGASCAPALHASAVAPVAVKVGTSFFESGGHRIRVDVYQPKSGGRHPAVIVVHGSSGVHRIVSDTASRYARALAEQGFVAFVAHYFDATGTFMASRAAESDHYDVWAGVLRDAVTWVLQLPEVDGGEVGLLGHSLGAFLVVGAAAFDPRVSRIVLFGGGLEPFLPVEIQHMPPALVFHGDRDEEVPLSDARNLVDFLRARHCEVALRVLPGQGHIFSEPAVSKVLTESAAFLMPARRSGSVP